MTPSGLVLFGLPLWLGMKASCQLNEHASASLCRDEKGHGDCLPHCACSKDVEALTECRSRSSCQPFKRGNLCLPYCGRKQVGCIDKKHWRPVIDKRCLKEGCNLCQLESKNCSEANCSRGLDLNCIKDFHVEVIADSFDVQEASKVNLTCEHNVSSVGEVKIIWFRDDKLRNESSRELILPKVFKKDEAKFSCGVHSACGFIISEEKHLQVSGDDTLIIIVCAVVAVVLLLAMALGMKYMLRRGRNQNRVRKQQRVPQTTENIYISENIYANLPVPNWWASTHARADCVRPGRRGLAARACC